MGIYCYTRRAQTKTTKNGIEIGRFAYAYKEHFWGDNGAYNRRVAVAHAHAETSTWKTRHVRLAIMGDFTDAAQERLAVFEITPDRQSFMDTKLPGKVVGYLTKIGRDYWFFADTKVNGEKMVDQMARIA